MVMKQYSAKIITFLWICCLLWGWQAEASTLTCGATQQVPLAECEALLDLYDYTNGDNRTNNSGRDTDTDVCTWYGVSCGSWSNVRALALPNNNLVGILPSSLSALTDIRYFDISSNGMWWLLPTEYSSWTNIQTFTIAHNDFDGLVPSSWSDNRSSIDIANVNMTGNCLTNSWSLFWSRSELILSQFSRNCPPSLTITKTLLSLWPISQWALLRYLISYTNEWTGTLQNVVLRDKPFFWLMFSGASRTGLVETDGYFFPNDYCYGLLYQSTTGPYVSDLNVWAISRWYTNMYDLLIGEAAYTWSANWWSAVIDITNSTQSGWFAGIMNDIFTELYGATGVNLIHPECTSSYVYKFYIGNILWFSSWSFTIDMIATWLVAGQTGLRNGLLLDGNRFSDDGWSKIGMHSNIVSVYTEHNVAFSCGNGMMEYDELCDDGNRFNGDGCAMDCQVETWWNCSVSTMSWSVCSLSSPWCNLIASPVTGSNPLSVQFTLDSVNTARTTIDKIDYGDGITTTWLVGLSFVHTYPSTGQYYPYVQVSNSASGDIKAICYANMWFTKTYALTPTWFWILVNNMISIASGSSISDIGWGGGWSNSMDYCPDGDNSSSYYDHLCSVIETGTSFPSILPAISTWETENVSWTLPYHDAAPLCQEAIQGTIDPDLIQDVTMVSLVLIDEEGNQNEIPVRINRFWWYRVKFDYSDPASPRYIAPGNYTVIHRVFWAHGLLSEHSEKIYSSKSCSVPEPTMILKTWWDTTYYGLFYMLIMIFVVSFAVNYTRQSKLL